MSIASAEVDFSAIEPVALGSWSAILRVTGHPDALLTSFDDVRGILEKTNLTDPLADAVQTIIDLGTDSGRDAILDAARDRKIEPEDWEDDESPQDLVARLWVEARSNDVVANLVDCALVVMREQQASRSHLNRVALSRDHRNRSVCPEIIAG